MERIRECKQSSAAGNVSRRTGRKGAPLHKKRYHATNYLCLLIALVPIVAFLVFNAFPVGLSFASMFTNMEFNDIGSMKWNSFENFRVVFSDPKLWKAWLVTIVLTSTQFVSLAIALVVSFLLEQRIKGGKLLQVIYFMPHICSTAAIAIMWRFVFDTHAGIINSIFGMELEWLNNIEKPQLLTIAVYITILWQAPAYGIVMLKAAYKNVSPALYEAAELDGANVLQKFRYVALPGVKPVVLFLVLAGITTGLGIFDQVLVLAPVQWTGVAGPDDAGLTINYYIYRQGVVSNEMELAAVASWFLFAVTFVVTYPIIRARNKASADS